MRQPSSPSVTSRTAFIARAKAGDWKAAEQASFRFPEDQVGAATRPMRITITTTIVRAARSRDNAAICRLLRVAGRLVTVSIPEEDRHETSNHVPESGDDHGD
jgi:hypothetical protein